VGTAMFSALALGGPIGSILYTSLGFSAIALTTALLPLMVMAYLVRVTEQLHCACCPFFNC
jgi:hypothetical protein